MVAKEKSLKLFPFIKTVEENGSVLIQGILFSLNSLTTSDENS